MKNLKIKIVFLLLLASNTLFAQNEQINLQKYMNYRETFKKEFVRIGYKDVLFPNGSSIPMLSKSKDPYLYQLSGAARQWEVCNFDTLKPYYNFTDNSNIELGKYLQMLATEFWLLKNAGQHTQATLHELYYAIAAAQRLEDNFDRYYSPGSFLSSRGKGCFLRGDVDSAYYRHFVPLDGSTPYIESTAHRTKSTYAPWDGGFNDCDTTNFDSRNYQSRDEFIGLLAGFAFVHKFVDDVYIKPTTIDEGFDLVTRVKELTHRMVDRVSRVTTWNINCDGQNREIQTSWWIVNPSNDLNKSQRKNSAGLLYYYAYPIAKIANQITGYNYETPLVYKEQNTTYPTILRSCPSVGMIGGIVATPNHLLIGPWETANVQPFQIGFNNFASKLWSGYVGATTAGVVAPPVSILDTTDINVGFNYNFVSGTLNIDVFRGGAPANNNFFLVSRLLTIPNVDLLAGGTFLQNTETSVGVNWALTLGALANLIAPIPFDLCANIAQMRNHTLTRSIMHTYPIDPLFYENLLNNAPYYKNPNNWVEPINVPNNGWVQDSINTGGWYRENFFFRRPVQLYRGSPRFVHSGMDYMLLFNMYRVWFAKFNPTIVLPQYNQAVACDCRATILRRDSLPANFSQLRRVRRMFDDYKQKGIQTPQYYWYDGAISLSGHLQLQNDFIMCKALKRQIISLTNNGILELGNTQNEKFLARFKDSTRLVLKSGSVLRVHQGSRLVIEPGAELVVSAGAVIDLVGSNAVLEIGGKLTLEDNAVFQTVGSGYVVFSTATPVVAMSGSSMVFEGAAPVGGAMPALRVQVNKALHIPNTLSHLRINHASVRGSGGFCVKSKLTLTNSRLESAFGVVVYGQNNVVINNNKFVDNGQGIILCIGEGSKQILITNCSFETNDNGITGAGGSFWLKNCTVTNSSCAIDAIAMTSRSIVENCTFNQNTSNIRYMASIGTNLLIKNSQITNSVNSLSNLEIGQTILRMECSKIENCMINDMVAGSKLDLSCNARNEFINNSWGTFGLDNALDANFENGYNKFQTNGASHVFGDLTMSNPRRFGSGNCYNISNNTITTQAVSQYGTPHASRVAFIACPTFNSTALLDFISIRPHFTVPYTNYTVASSGSTPYAGCGIASPSVCYPTPIVNVVGQKKIITQDFPINIEIGTAILTALNNVSDLSGIKNDLVAVDLFNQILTAPLTSLATPDEAEALTIGYDAMLTAFANATEQGLVGRNIDYLQKVIKTINHLDRHIDDQNDAFAYRKHFEYLMDKAQVYMVVRDYDQAITHFEDLKRLALPQDAQDGSRAEFWHCIASEMAGYTSENTTETDYMAALETCKKVYKKQTSQQRIDRQHQQARQRLATRLLILPNPSQNEAILLIESVDNASAANTIVVSDVLGKTLQIINLQETGNLVRMPLTPNEFETGIYIVSQQINGKTIAQTKWAIVR